MKKIGEILYLIGIPLVLAFGLIISHYYPFLLPVSTFGLFGLYMFLFSPFKKIFARILFIIVFIVNLIGSVLLYFA
ncbi:DUF5970 family protein [Heyndrickxia coagulans]|uniref:DUF5970 family protein n=1 Tax=Heyndrickxia coagulans TaxID=1398 RepID=UPI002E9E4B21|nr:DUF5970 family protein [Heyndrickxia coagulans]